MWIEDPQDLEGLLEAGRIVRAALEAMREQVRPGVTTAELNRVAAELLHDRGARSAPMMVYNFPTETCISVNEEIVHGIPSNRVLLDGDLVKLDVTVEKNGYIADAAITVASGELSTDARRLIDCVRSAFERAMEVALAGNPLHAIGRAVEEEVSSRGMFVLRALTGHGVGRQIHEEPLVPNFYDPRSSRELTEGLVIAVEPLVSLGTGRVIDSPDGWTMRTGDGSLAAHYEQTLVITDGAPRLLTAS